LALSPGRRLGAYEIVALIGSGGTGEVWRATDTRLNKDRLKDQGRFIVRHFRRTADRSRFSLQWIRR
jgi:hypothetical protein